MREASILLPLVLLVLVVLSIATLSAYRSSLESLGSLGGAGSAEIDREVARQRVIAERLTWVVLAVGVALVIFVLFYLRHLISPFEALLGQARDVAAIDESEARDDVDYLVSTFERALEALAGSHHDDSNLDEEREIAALQRTLGSSLDSGVLLLDDSDRVLALNPVGCELLGLEPPEDARPALSEYGARHPALVELLGNAEASPEDRVSRRELSLERTDGSTLTLGLTTHELHRDDGTRRGRLALFADLTEDRERSNREQRASSLAQLGRMSAGLAHELRNALAALRGYLTLIERQPDEDTVHDYLGEIRGETDHLQRVVEDFLSFARPEARLETFRAADLARHLQRDPALAVPVELDNELPPDLELRADRQLLERALRNLVRNGAAAHEEAGSGEALVLRLFLRERELVIEVADRGAGIDPVRLEEWFEPFATSRPDGVGLGLPLAQRILDLHGGALALEPRAGGGTTAAATLPIDTIVT